MGVASWKGSGNTVTGDCWDTPPGMEWKPWEEEEEEEEACGRSVWPCVTRRKKWRRRRRRSRTMAFWKLRSLQL